MTKMTYTDMVDSGIEWIGKIPKERTMRKNKWFLIRNKNTIWTRNTDEYPLLSLTLKWVIEKDKENNDWKIPESYDTYQIVEKNSLILCLFDIDVTPRIVWITPKKGMITWAYTNFSVNEKIADINFMYYFLLRMNIENIFLHMSKSLRSTITYGQFLVQYSCLPNLVTQQAIASYLDSKTAQIDQAISLKTQQIELLREKRTALVNHVVTKWLDPNVELVDSGIEWIGKIPKGWEVRKLKYCWEAIIWLTYSPEDTVDEWEWILVLRSSNIQNKVLAYDNNVYVRNEIINDKLLTKAWDILMCSRNWSKELIGKCAIIEKASAGTMFGVFMTIYRTPYYRFIYYFFNSIIFRQQLSGVLTSTINQLTINSLYSMISTLPPLSEQQSIASYLDTKTAEIDQTITLVQKSIDLLVESSSHWSLMWWLGKWRWGKRFFSFITKNHV